jgi:hypothetical protein
MDWDWTMES